MSLGSHAVSEAFWLLKMIFGEGLMARYSPVLRKTFQAISKYKKK